MSREQLTIDGEFHNVDEEPKELGPKQTIIEWVYNLHHSRPAWDPIVTYEELFRVREILGQRICKTNLANFFYFSKLPYANSAWPPSVLAAGYTGLARIGKNRCFEFVPLPPGQRDAFVQIERPNGSTFYGDLRTDNGKLSDRFRRFKRDDEVRLVTVVEKSGLVSEFFKLVEKPEGAYDHNIEPMQSPLRSGSRGEADSFYIGEWLFEDGSKREFMIAVEAKKTGCDLFLSQMFHHTNLALTIAEESGDCDMNTTPVYSLGIETVGKSQVYVIQYKPMLWSQLEDPGIAGMVVGAKAVYTFRPGVFGIGGFGMDDDDAPGDKRQGSLLTYGQQKTPKP